MPWVGENEKLTIEGEETIIWDSRVTNTVISNGSFNVILTNHLYKSERHQVWSLAQTSTNLGTPVAS